MPAYNFKEQFVVPIRSGRKRHTIRAKRRRATKAGERLQLYVGMRTKRCMKIIPDPVCSKVQDITINTNGYIHVDGIELDGDECVELAEHDGFPTFRSMMEFWEGRLPFRGDIIHWRPA
jgi:hypothetical protein